ncbi:thiamine pyrophosphate-binding protein [Herbiconiux daphne]|uniref:Thiamine pyrophosphate-binding protein n=1 Tax=Herbiconiux daphne TaxID=2970914 RepID=A0ABT2H591_9MICO|nr:thiamine pyrophosphate-binding protein [Herbiconiux daphne]MCS5735079.1 thiamine pyrophosphate-binding protein [Herbiconiux daphne]
MPFYDVQLDTLSVSTWIAQETSTYVTQVFGVMGNGNALYIDALIGSGVHYNSLRHEAGAVAAADAYSRTTGGVGVATTTFGAGFTNTLTALADAVRARSTIVVVTGDAPSTGYRTADVDVPALVRGVGATSWTLVPGREAQIARLAFESAVRDARPAVISVPYDLSDAPIADPHAIFRPHVGLRPGGVVSHASAVVPQRLTTTLLSARRLLVIAGHGVVLAGAQRLAARLVALRSAASATTVMAHGLFTGQRGHLGLAGGFSSNDAAEQMRTADVVLVLGASLNESTTRSGTLFSPAARVIQVDVLEQPTSDLVTDYLKMDVAEFLSQVLDAHDDSASPEPWAERTAGASAQDSARGLHPQLLSHGIAGLLPVNTSIVLDGGNFMAWPLDAWPVRSTDAFVPAGLSFQSIGLGLPAWIGAALGRRDRLPVLAVGDGGLLMSFADLESAARLVDRGLIVVYNDSAYGAELHQYEAAGLSSSPMRFPTTDFAAAAEALGMRAIVVTSLLDLEDLELWLDNGAEGVMLLDCRIADDVAAPFLER